MDRASVQNLVSKLVKDAERRKYSAEKTQFLKEEEEERQLSAPASQFFTRRNNNNKAESKIKQYINKSLERTTNSREKLSKSSSKASLVREISPQKVRFTNERIANQTLIEHITSPNKSKRTKSARKGDFELACEKELKGKITFSFTLMSNLI